MRIVPETADTPVRVPTPWTVLAWNIVDGNLPTTEIVSAARALADMIVREGERSV